MAAPAEQSDWPLGQAADDSIVLIQARIPAVTILSAMPNERYDDTGKLANVVDVGFMLPPERAIFYVHPLAQKGWQFHTLHDITLKANKVLSIYQGLRRREDIIPLVAPTPADYEFALSGAA